MDEVEARPSRQSSRSSHVTERALGQVCVSPVDVVLDESGALVLQPDIIFIAADRLGIVNERVWGSPDLVVEVLWPRTAGRDRTTKVHWYLEYGVRECWLMNIERTELELVVARGGRARRITFPADRRIASTVLPAWTLTPGEIVGASGSR